MFFSVLVFQVHMEGNRLTTEAVEGYFWKGYKYSEILALLKSVHHHETTIDRFLRKRGLKRRGVDESVKNAIEVALLK